MTPQELYELWAPKHAIWSPWVLPVPFAQLQCLAAGEPAVLPDFHLEWLPNNGARDVALVVDLPGATAIHLGLALLEAGFRPVPVIDGSPGPGESVVVGLLKYVEHSAHAGVAVDMRGLLRALCEGAEHLRRATIAADAAPAFLLDSRRMATAADLEKAYDNRWRAFPQDFPSGRFLREHGIRRVVLVQDRFSKQPQDDLAHVLLRWQEEGIAIESKSMYEKESPEVIKVSRPSWYRAAWYRVIAALGLRRNDAGGFGGYPKAVSGGG